MNKKHFFLVVIILLAIPVSVFAQEEGGSPVYIVQPGDTLSSIALRFGIDINNVIAANDIANPDQLFQGTPLTLSGVDWVSGTLDARTVSFGETFRTLSRRYHLDPYTFARLNTLTSPGQLFVGYPAILPSNGSEVLLGERRAIGSQTTFLEMAAEAGKNPWSISLLNRLESPAYAVRGDVFLILGTSDGGPGAIPSPVTKLSISPTPLIQGKTTVFKVSAGGQGIALSGKLIDSPLHFFPTEDGQYTALQGVYALQEPGLYPLTISGQLEDGSEFAFSQLIAVVEGGYDFETITVDPAYLDDSITNQESELVQSYVAEATSEKYWSGVFQLPSPYGDVFNSFFGTRRSFNGSGFIYYHAGLDFGGGEGVEIYAPAYGKVVFAGPLEVRGNATIIDHGWGVYSGYWHQSRIDVQEGDFVQPGQVIGLVGNTGRSSGAHLHWEIWAGSIQVDPFDWLYIAFP